MINDDYGVDRQGLGGSVPWATSSCRNIYVLVYSLRIDTLIEMLGRTGARGSFVINRRRVT